MSEIRTVQVPGLALNYNGNRIESIGMGGEMYVRDTPLRVENAKLREENLRLKTLVEDMHRAFFSLDVDYCQACPRDNRLYPCPRYTIGGGECKFETEMRELGIEVD